MKSSNAMVVRVLKAAKENLQMTGVWTAGKCTYLCNAVAYTANGDVKRSPAWWRAVTEIQAMISKRLGCGTLEEWLQKQGIPRSELVPSAMQAHRAAWLDILIAEFSVK